MGDIPISYIEGVGGIRVSEDEIVQVGKHDVGVNLSITKLILVANSHPSFLGTILQAWPIDFSIQFIYSCYDWE